jgi:hypothetical protein
MSRLSEKLTYEIEKILPQLRKDLQLELYRTIGYVPKQAFYSDNRVFGAFYNEAGKYLSLVGHDETEVEKFCAGEFHADDENRKKIQKIATLALVQLAMW